MKPIGSALLIATTNEGKLREFADLFVPIGISCRSNADYGLGSPQETGATFVENARLKAVAGTEATGLTTLGDDSGLLIEKLGGAPGLHSADWADMQGRRDYTAAMARIRRELIARSAAEPWMAEFRTALVLRWPDGHEEVFEGSLTGEVVWPPMGTNGHGYDPIFRPAGSSLTFGQMPNVGKRSMSHRAIAVAKLISAFRQGAER